MGQEFFINSQELEDKIRTLLPSQGGAGAGFDLSASTQIVPIIDLTESAEGSNVRSDLQTALSFDSITAFEVSNNVNVPIITNTGWFRVFGLVLVNGSTSGNINIFDGTTAKNIFFQPSATSGGQNTTLFDFVVKMEAGDSLRATSNNASCTISGNTRQIADVAGNLTNP